MTNEEFFNMNVGDKFKVCNSKYKVCNSEYVVVETFLNGCNKCIRYKMPDDNTIYTLTQLFISIIGIHFITLAQKLPSKTPIEKVQEKIDQLKLELSKLEDEKKSLEIQVGKFYEVVRKNDKFVGFVNYKTKNYYRMIVGKVNTDVYISEIISFKKIDDISVVEEAWKNV